MIHYPGLPMTRVMDMIRAMRARHAMLSFHDARQIEEASEVCQSIVLDNGAFSAWRQGIPYNFAGYQTWAAYWLKHPCVESAVVPDVIDATEQENDQLLSEWSLPLAVSVPRYHLHESLERLNRLCAYPRIALGSSGQFAHPGSREWWSRLAQIMTCLCDQQGYPRCKLHGLRMLDPVIFSHVPLASADSCNVARNIGIDSAWTGPYAPPEPMGSGTRHDGSDRVIRRRDGGTEKAPERSRIWSYWADNLHPARLPCLNWMSYSYWASRTCIYTPRVFRNSQWVRQLPHIKKLDDSFGEF